MRTAIIAEVIASFVPAAAFVVLYAARSPWWRSGMGRHLMAFVGTLVVLLGLVLLGWIVGPLPRIVWVVGLAPLPVVVWWRLWLLLRAQRRD